LLLMLIRDLNPTQKNVELKMVSFFCWSLESLIFIIN
jgi:hypothetical protein